MSSVGRARLVGVAVERQSRRARLEECVVHDWGVRLGGGGSAGWIGGVAGVGDESWPVLRGRLNLWRKRFIVIDLLE